MPAPSACDLRDDHQGGDGAIADALLEIAFDLAHLVGDVCQTEDRLLPCRGECLERRRFHLDRENAGCARGVDCLGGFPKWRIRGPARPHLHGDAGGG